MSKPRLYLLALCAMQTNSDWKPVPGDNFSRAQTIEGSDMPTMALWAQGVVAASDEEARATGMEVILEACPLGEGWINHIVAANTISPEMFNRIVRDVT